MNKFNKSEEELKKELPGELYRVARQSGTEIPFTGEYVMTKDQGVYKCSVCGQELFSSDSKFITQQPGLEGWPSFEKALEGSVEFKEDNTLGMKRTEVLCSRCGSHLGHIFPDKEETKTGEHFCINSVCLKLEKQ